ncbi:MAG: HTTM domain-containing protein [Pirellulales bacterium]|nr:HTTM domain-containing protein [Pirellulales bacterium]
MSRSWRTMLGQPVDGASLAFARCGLGIALATVLAEYVWPHATGTALQVLISGPGVTWLQPYPGLSWIRPLGEPWSTALVWLGVVACLCFAAGLFYRLAAVLQVSIFTWLWLLDQSIYGNHFYLGSVLALLFALLPAGNRWSLDNLIQSATGSVRPTTTVPYGAIVLLRAQMWLVYFFAGASKIHPDWLSGEPIRTWFRGGVPVERLAAVFGSQAVAGLQPVFANEATIYFFSYAGLIFDLVVGTLLCLRRTRAFAFAAACFFHLTNFLAMERVGVVAPLAWVGTTLFFAPDWPLAFVRWLRRPRIEKPDWPWFFAGLLLFPLGLLLGWRSPSARPPSADSSRPLSRAALAVATAWFALQLFLSLRHFVIPGDGYWTEEGMRFSWALMTRNKTGQFTRFEVDDPRLFRRQGASGWTVDPVQWAASPPLIYDEIDAPAVAWERLPAVFLACEPLLGERCFFRPAAGESGTGDVARAAVVRLWPELRGQEFRLTPVVPLERLLATAEHELASQRSLKRPNRESFADVLRAVHVRAREVQATDNPALQLRAVRGLTNRLLQIAQALPASSMFQRELSTLAPWMLQGARAPSTPLFVIEGNAWRAPGENVLAIWRQTMRRPGPELVDLDRLESRFWGMLPPIVIVRTQGGAPRVCWNYWLDTTPQQRESLAIFPHVLQSYAAHVAETWQARFQRRPGVRAVAYVELNGHPQALLVDPRVDLASAPLVHLGHNAWILPRGATLKLP